MPVADEVTEMGFLLKDASYFGEPCLTLTACLAYSQIPYKFQDILSGYMDSCCLLREGDEVNFLSKALRLCEI